MQERYRYTTIMPLTVIYLTVIYQEKNTANTNRQIGITEGRGYRIDSMKPDLSMLIVMDGNWRPATTKYTQSILNI
jgi:hypothetical protein